MSRKSAAVLSVRPEALNSWLALGDALDRMSDEGRSPVCRDRPDQWSADAPPPARKDAAEACGFCQARAACLAFAQANREPGGVWGAFDFTSTTRKGGKAA